MTGISVDNLDALIKKNNLYLNSVNIGKKKLVNSINEFYECYNGSSLEYLFGILSQTPNIQKISDIVKNYSDILYGVKVSYQKQDSVMVSHINKLNSKKM